MYHRITFIGLTTKYTTLMWIMLSMVLRIDLIEIGVGCVLNELDILEGVFEVVGVLKRYVIIFLVEKISIDLQQVSLLCPP